jgi:hypothetical protein
MDLVWWVAIAVGALVVCMCAVFLLRRRGRSRG